MLLTICTTLGAPSPPLRVGEADRERAVVPPDANATHWLLSMHKRVGGVAIPVSEHAR